MGTIVICKSVSPDWRSNGCPNRPSPASRTGLVFGLWVVAVFTVKDKGTSYAGFHHIQKVTPDSQQHSYTYVALRILRIRHLKTVKSIKVEVQWI